MEGFTNIDIFETKGIEYIVIIFFLLILIPFWILINKTPIVKNVVESVKFLTTAILNVPQGVFFNKNHTWSYLEKSGAVIVGIDDFLLKITGDVSIVNKRNPGDLIKQGELVAELNQEGKKLQIFSPLTGQIKQFNFPAIKYPDYIINDPYGRGWLYTIEPDAWKEETADSSLGKDAETWFAAELARLKDFLAIALQKHSGIQGVVLQEGGELKINPLEDLQKGIWEDFQKEFLEHKQE